MLYCFAIRIRATLPKNNLWNQIYEVMVSVVILNYTDYRFMKSNSRTVFENIHIHPLSNQRGRSHFHFLILILSMHYTWRLLCWTTIETFLAASNEHHLSLEWWDGKRERETFFIPVRGWNNFQKQVQLPNHYSGADNSWLCS